MMEVRKVNNFGEALKWILPIIREAEVKNLPITIDEKNWVIVIQVPKYVPVKYMGEIGELYGVKFDFDPEANKKVSKWRTNFLYKCALNILKLGD